MKAFIPEIGSKLKTEEDWTFDLFLESRNSSIYHDADGHPESVGYKLEPGSYKRTLPKGTEVIIDRIYVRKNASGYSSVSMYITKTADKKISKVKPKNFTFASGKEKHYGRFWVKLADFNNANFEVIKDLTRKGEPTLVKGKPLSFKSFKGKGKYRKHWVTFNHPDPELSFDGILETCKCEWEHGVPHGADLNMYEIKEFDTYTGDKFYKCKRKYYIHNIIPESWHVTNKDNKKFYKKATNRNNSISNLSFFYYYNPSLFPTQHPLENEINITTDRDKQKLLGLTSAEMLLENIEIAGGKLSICEVEEKFEE